MVDGLHNFRDIANCGGALPPGRLYRSDHLKDLTPLGVDQLARKCRSVVNLISREQKLGSESTDWAAYDERFEARGVRVFELGINTQAQAMKMYVLGAVGKLEAYKGMLSDRTVLDKFRAALRVFSQPENLPAVFHCHSGMDRTGLLSMLCLLAVGAEASDIVADYAVTSTPEFSGTPESQWRSHLHMPSIRELGKDEGTNIFVSEASTMEGLLTWLAAQFGGRADGILTAPNGLALSAEQVAALKAALLAPAGDNASGTTASAANL